MVEQIALPLADAQMFLAWMDETFGNDSGMDWSDEDAAAVGDALNKAIENFKRMRAACGVKAVDLPPLPEPDCWAILTPNGSKLVSPEEAKGAYGAYGLYTSRQMSEYRLTPSGVPPMSHQPLSEQATKEPKHG